MLGKILGALVVVLAVVGIASACPNAVGVVGVNQFAVPQFATVAIPQPVAVVNPVAGVQLVGVNQYGVNQFGVNQFAVGNQFVGVNAFAPVGVNRVRTVNINRNVGFNRGFAVNRVNVVNHGFNSGFNVNATLGTNRFNNLGRIGGGGVQRSVTRTVIR